MNIHEYQAKELLIQYGIPIQKGNIARTPQEARAIAEHFGGPVVVKAQVHSGGRGKAGGTRPGVRGRRRNLGGLDYGQEKGDYVGDFAISVKYIFNGTSLSSVI